VAPSETTKAGAAVKRQRVLSGMRPTGKLHIGNYFGALPNWLKLQTDDSNDCYFFVADWHSLTSDYADTSQIAQNSIEIATDFLASGLDPNKSTIFQQSQVPEHAELHLLLSMVTPLGWLERVPTYKEALENIKDKDLHTYGFLGYPVLQTADIVMYGEPNLPLVVPVGEDQVAHVELGREIVATFNLFYGYEAQFEKWRREDYDTLLQTLYPRSVSISGSVSGDSSRSKSVSGAKSRAHSVSGADSRAHSEARSVTEQAFRMRVRQDGVVNVAARVISLGASQYFQVKPVLCEPQAMLTPAPRVPGTDGRKMSKSYNNSIALGESNEEIQKKTRGMMTDPARKLRTDPGNPDVCPVFSWHKLFSTPEVIERVNRDCRTAAIGCVDCKHVMADALINWIEPIRARRKEYESKPGEVLEILDAGSKKAREVAKSTMARVREAVFGWEKTRSTISAGAGTKHNLPPGSRGVKAGD
jgi:tryptophanyl-tRNA synthetase